MGGADQSRVNRQYWFGSHQESGWTPGAAWKLVFPDGRIGDTGEIVDVERPKRLVIKWRNEFRPELKAEGYTRCSPRCSFDIEPQAENVKLTVTHVAPAEPADRRQRGPRRDRRCGRRRRGTMPDIHHLVRIRATPDPA